MCFYELTICTQCNGYKYKQWKCGSFIPLVPFDQATYPVEVESDEDAARKLCKTCCDALCGMMENV